MRADHPLLRIGGPVLGAVLVILAVVLSVNRFQQDLSARRAAARAKVQAPVAAEASQASPAGQEAATPAAEPTATPTSQPGGGGETTVPTDFTTPADVTAAFSQAGCAGCHTIPGIPGANGRVGPDLSHIGVDAATRIEGRSAEDYIRESILDPNAFIAPDCWGHACPAGVMLQTFAQTLSQDDLNTIVGYLLKLGTGELAAAETEAAPRSGLIVSLPPESVLEPFAPLPQEPASEAQIALGKYLFFDQRLSGNVSLSCASCHQPDQAFTDGQALSAGFPSTKYFRNTPTLYNTVFADYRYWDGRMDGGDMATLVRDHLTEAHFMAMDGRLMVERMNQVPEYVGLFQEAFGGEPSFGKVLKAIAAYVSTLNSPPGPYDAALAGDTSAFDADARAGYELFTGKAGCSDCHSGALLSDGQFHNTGVGTDPSLFDDPERSVTFRRFFRTLGVPAYRHLREDVGRYALTLDQGDWGKFRTPSLREVGRTAPYMHDGSLATLEDVVRFYNAGGGEGQTAGLEPLGLSDTEIAQLVAFLESLSSEPVTVETPTLPDYGIVEPGAAASAAAPVMEETAAPPAAATETPPEAATEAAGPSEAAVAAITKAGCGACHVIPDVPGAVGALGPDLTNIGADAATRIEGRSAEEYIRESILDPNAFIAPRCPAGDCMQGVMPPNFGDLLNADELNAIVDYLVTLGRGR